MRMSLDENEDGGDDEGVTTTDTESVHPHLAAGAGAGGANDYQVRRRTETHQQQRQQQRQQQQAEAAAALLRENSRKKTAFLKELKVLESRVSAAEREVLSGLLASRESGARRDAGAFIRCKPVLGGPTSCLHYVCYYADTNRFFYIYYF